MKTCAVDIIASSMAIDLSQTMAVGDGANDLKMLETAGIMQHSEQKPVVRASSVSARHVTGWGALSFGVKAFLSQKPFFVLETLF